ncbi:MAG TPA: iron ABC transporter substrate-binding protein [Eubacteriaceae bacterium]|nr:iron ABC transporter substrate-binding protein [Eubacteriaceae bacterium]
MILFGLALLLVACSTDSVAEETAQENNNDESAETRVITDAFGREVEIPRGAASVASIGSAARIITYAGAADKLVGVTDMDKENISAMPYTVVNAERFEKLVSVGAGGANDTPYVEELIMLQPDIIIGNTDEGTLNNVYEKTGIPTIGIYPDGMFDESVYFAIELAGEVLGTESQSLKVVEEMKKWEEELDQLTREIPEEEKPSVYSGGVSYRGAQGFDGTMGDYPPFSAIHAKNLAKETGEQGAFLIDLEQVAVWDPDKIFLNSANMPLVRQDYEKNTAFYEGLTAVKKGEVYSQIPYNYNSTNVEIAIANAYYAGKVIYPDAFKKIDPVQKADEIFTVMLGESFYEKLAEDGNKFGKIIIGE